MPHTAILQGCSLLSWQCCTEIVEDVTASRVIVYEYCAQCALNFTSCQQLPEIEFVCRMRYIPVPSIYQHVEDSFHLHHLFIWRMCFMSKRALQRIPCWAQKAPMRLPTSTLEQLNSCEARQILEALMLTNSDT